MSDSPKIGAGHASAMFRLGLREARNAMNPSPQSVADTEMGLYGTRTPGEVADIRSAGVQPAQAETEPEAPQPERSNSGPELEL